MEMADAELARIMLNGSLLPNEVLNRVFDENLEFRNPQSEDDSKNEEMEDTVTNVHVDSDKESDEVIPTEEVPAVNNVYEIPINSNVQNTLRIVRKGDSENGEILQEIEETDPNNDINSEKRNNEMSLLERDNTADSAITDDNSHFGSAKTEERKKSNSWIELYEKNNLVWAEWGK
ncbi:hypothetical protein TKK_0015563 [Trichogramma kaykai]